MMNPASVLVTSIAMTVTVVSCCWLVTSCTRDENRQTVIQAVGACLARPDQGAANPLCQAIRTHAINP